MSFLGRVRAMFTNKPIFGVGPGEVAAAADDESESRFLPESKMIHGVSEGWKPWRVDADGERWYRRDDGSETPVIHGEATDDDLNADEYDAQVDNSDILESFRRECAIIKARHSRGELPDSTEDDSND